MIYRQNFDSFLGNIIVEADDRYLLAIHLSPKLEQNPNAITQMAIQWLESYFQRVPQNITLPLRSPNTLFGQKVREAVMQIPFGHTAAYQKIAQRAGNEKAARAVGILMRHNPYMLYVPCHRVTAKKGVGGYNGGIEIKKRLLEFENCE